MPLDLLTTWTDRAAERVATQVANARAHAGKAVTEALRQTPDGRPTIRRAARSPSLLAALRRLDELLDALAGPSAASREGLLRDAYAALYRQAVAKWAPLIPADLRIQRPEPTAANLVRARALAPHGMDLRREIDALLVPIRQRLAAAVVLSSSPSALASGRDRLDAWERAARDAITRAAALLLGDAEVALDRQAGLDLVRPEAIDRTPLEVD